MPTLDRVYWKFGFASEAAQLLETELGNLLLEAGAMDANLFEEQDPTQAKGLLEGINRRTLGQLIKGLKLSAEEQSRLEPLLSKALLERNRLAHSFYRQHNFRRNTEEGREIMMNDLVAIHETIMEAYKAVMKLSGVDLDSCEVPEDPTTHLPI